MKKQYVKLKRTLRNFYMELLESMYMEAGYQRTCTGKNQWLWWIFLNELFTMMHHRFGVWVCKHFGHHIVDNGSYATPDSGAEHHCCDRCGQHWDHIYY